MGYGGQRHAPAALPIVPEAGWAPGCVWTGAENLATPRNSFPGTSNPQQVAIPTELSRLSTYKGKPKCGKAGVRAPLIPKLGTLAGLLPKEMAAVGHRTGGWLGSRASPGH